MFNIKNQTIFAILNVLLVIFGLSLLAMSISIDKSTNLKSHKGFVNILSFYFVVLVVKTIYNYVPRSPIFETGSEIFGSGLYGPNTQLETLLPKVVDVGNIGMTIYILTEIYKNKSIENRKNIDILIIVTVVSQIMNSGFVFYKEKLYK